MARFSILHISDLHRIQSEPIGNSSLKTSILKDIEGNSQHFEKIKLIVVSGDLIQGSLSQDLTKAKEEIEKQYEEAYSFLKSLSKTILNNQNESVILVPGNHDISWPISKQSMEKIPKLEKDYSKELKFDDSMIRWSWKDLSFYKVQNVQRYNQRLQFFKKFYDLWYDEKRTFSLEPKDQFEIFDYPELDTTIIGLNSCYNNDHLRLSGSFCSDALAQMDDKLRQMELRPLRIGAWHHNTYGGPMDNDYLHIHYLQNLMNFKFNIGLYGHKHKTEVVNLNAKYSNSDSIITISSGSLCVGGSDRQYNIIEVNSEDPELRLFIRKSVDINTPFPIWKQGELDYKNELSYKVKFKLHEKQTFNKKNTINKIIDLYGQKFFSDALELISLQKINNPYIHKLHMECLRELRKNNDLIELLKDPQTDEEILYLIEALREKNDKSIAKEIFKKINFQLFKIII